MMTVTIIIIIVTAITITIITIIIIIRSNQRLGGAIKIHVKGKQIAEL